jgi:enhancing lycopene biosynthesis protein 2
MASYKDKRENTVSSAETQRVVETTPARARQSFLGRPVLMVLIGSLVLAAIAWGIAGQYGESIGNDAATTKQQTTTGTKAVVTPSDQTVIDNTPPAGEKMQTAPTDRDPTAESSTGGNSQSVVPSGSEKTQ